MEAPREKHLVAVKCILRYVAGTRGWVVVKRILLYVAKTRGWGVRYCVGRGKEVVVKCILLYLAETRGWGVRYYIGRGKEKLELVGYTDSDMAGDVDDRKSTNEMIYFLSGGVIY